MGRKVKSFKSEWLNKEVEGIEVKTWCVSDPNDRQNAKCLLCPPTTKMPFGRTFSICEGFTAIVKHFNRKTHQDAMRDEADREDHGNPAPRQIDIEKAIQNQEELTEKDSYQKNQLLKSQILFTNFVHTHLLPSDIFTCFAELAPKMFPDSNIAKRWAESNESMRRTKGDYFLTHGLHPHIQNILVEALRSNFFSLNFDESAVNKTSQLDLNVSFIKEKTAVKQNLTTLSMDQGTSAQEVVDVVVEFFESNLIPLNNIIVVTTDGCSTMLGDDNGVQSILRRRIPHLPRWGGCSCHDLSNLLKAGVSKLNPSLTSLYSHLHSYLSSASLHRLRKYQECCHEQGFESHSIPKLFDVRFRTITACARWMEEDFWCLYLWFSKLAEDVKNGDHKDITAAEEFILKNFSSDIIRVRLCNMFILDVGEQIMALINHFEGEGPNIYERYELIADFLVTFMGKFLVNGGEITENDEEIKISDILQVEFRERKAQLSNKDIFLGSRADGFISELGLTRSSPELTQWFDQVRSFYCEAFEKALKYFKPALLSRVLQDCDILDPKAFYSCSLDTLKRKIKNLATKFDCVINGSQIPALLDQVASLRSQGVVRERVKEGITPVMFFSRLIEWKEGKYKLIGVLGCALLTIHSSGSSAERDFSLMNCVVGDPKKNRTGQLRMEARLSLKSHNLNLKHGCLKCETIKENAASKERNNNEENSESEDDIDERVDVKSVHCHCSMFTVGDEMIADMSDGQPSRRYKADMKSKRDKLKIEKVLLRDRFQNSARNFKTHMKTELARYRRSLQKNNRQQPVQVPRIQSEAEKKAERLRRKNEIEEDRRNKKARLDLLF